MNSIQQMLLHFCIILGLSYVLAQPTLNLLADRSYCGYQHTDDYVRQSNNISIDEFPWVAQLLYGELLIVRCSGSLINNRYVLTTAHCLKSKDSALSMVRLGDYSVKTETDCVSYGDETECSDAVEDFQIEEKIVHLNYKRRDHKNDIGLIRLARTVQYSDYIRPICMPQKNRKPLQPGEVLMTTGWGVVGHGLDYTELKKRLEVVLITNDECNEHYKDYGIRFENTELCAKETDSFTCQGDSGAPLMYSVKNQYEQIAMVSFGRGCGNKNPTVYTNIINYVDWIEDNLRK